MVNLTDYEEPNLLKNIESVLERSTRDPGVVNSAQLALVLHTPVPGPPSMCFRVTSILNSNGNRVYHFYSCLSPTAGYYALFAEGEMFFSPFINRTFCWHEA